MGTGFIVRERQRYHAMLIAQEVLGLRKKENKLTPTNADRDNDRSVAIAQLIADAICRSIGRHEPLPIVNTSSQALGTRFTEITKEFVQRCFDRIQFLRPGTWQYSTEQTGIARFHQYHHLAEIERIMESHAELRIWWGSDYIIRPDIVVSRMPIEDLELNIQGEVLVGPHENVARHTPLRRSSTYQSPNAYPILHASISCKWTMRSDRAQNTRTEALNLIRNRKGRTPMIVAVTAEPLPTRLASLALGTGDIDRVYHFALYELIDAVREVNDPNLEEMLQTLIDGQRLADISDLPFDLAI